MTHVKSWISYHLIMSAFSYSEKKLSIKYESKKDAVKVVEWGYPFGYDIG